MRRATEHKRQHNSLSRHFYPRSPCGERLFSCFWCIFYLYISIHALLAESDHIHAPNRRPYQHFYPRSPCGERQDRPRPSAGINDFYPRSPCGERLSASDITCAFGKDFYPRSPCGERLEKVPADVFYSAFLSTLSLRRATRRPGLFFQYFWISIHALLAESDRGGHINKARS